MKFCIFAIFMKHFLNSRYEYANRLVDVIASKFSFNFLLRNVENPLILAKYEKVKLALFPLWINAK